MGLLLALSSRGVHAVPIDKILLGLILWDAEHPYVFPFQAS